MCCGRDKRVGTTNQPERKPGPIASAESMMASAKSRYLVVATRTATTGKTFATLTAAQDYARRSGGIVRQL